MKKNKSKVVLIFIIIALFLAMMFLLIGKESLVNWTNETFGIQIVSEEDVDLDRLDQTIKPIGYFENKI